MVSQASLPVDLYRAIVEYVSTVDKLTLLALSKTCKALNVEAERLLYHSVVELDSEEAHTQFLAAVAIRGRASLISAYSNGSHWPRDLKEYSRYGDWCTYSVLSPALQSFVNLKTLKLWGPLDSCAMWTNIPKFPFQLEYLYCNSVGIKDLVTLLRSQRNLVELHCFAKQESWMRADEKLFTETKFFLPNLKRLAGNSAVLRALLPIARNVITLQWIHDGGSAIEDFEQEVKRILANVQVFTSDLTINDVRRDRTIELFYPFLRNVKVLNLFLPDHPGPVLWRIIRRRIEMHPNHNVLETVQVQSLFDMNLQQQVVEECFQLVPNLEIVNSREIIQDNEQPLKEEEIQYRHWERGSTESVALDGRMPNFFYTPELDWSSRRGAQ